MLQSRPVTQSGHLLGIAAHAERGWTFIAIDPRMEELHGQDFRDFPAIERVARLVFARATTPPTRH